MDEAGTNAPAGGVEGAETIGRVQWPPLLVALLSSADDGERDWAWRTFYGAYGATIACTVRHAIARSAIAGDDTRLQDATRWVLRQLVARDCHALRAFDGRSSFTTFLVASVVALTRVYLAASRRARADEDGGDDAGGVTALVPPPTPPPLAGGAPWPADFGMA